MSGPACNGLGAAKALRRCAVLVALLAAAGCAPLKPLPVATTLSAGDSYSCRLRGGVAYCWGWADLGLTGDKTTPHESMAAPTPLPTEESFKAVSAGGVFNGPDTGHSCAVSPSGALRCWGDNRFGQLARDPATLTRSIEPVTVLAGTAFTAVSTGGTHSCAITVGKKIMCWGDDSMWQSGQGTQVIGQPSVVVNPQEPVPRQGFPLPLEFESVSAGATHSCAIAVGGDLWCWGSNTSGQLGIPRSSTSVNVLRPHHVGQWTNGAVQRFVQVSAGPGMTCGIDTNSEAYCWGASGPLGGGMGPGNNSPIPLVARVRTGQGASMNFKSIAAGEHHACAINTSDQPYCWGNNFSGQLGIGVAQGPGQFYATPVADLTEAKAIVVGTVHTCALNMSGAALCWGSRSLDALGDNHLFPPQTNGQAPSPQLVTGFIAFDQIVAGPAHNCGLAKDGSVHCWGQIRGGQLGVAGSREMVAGRAPLRSAPVPAVRGAVLQQLAGGGYHACGREALGQLITAPGNTAPTLYHWVPADSVRCWGSTNTAQLGAVLAGSPTCPGPFGCWETTAPALQGTLLKSVGAGDYHTCGALGSGAAASGQAVCWGVDNGAQLGVPPANAGSTCASLPCSNGPVVPSGLPDVVQITGGARHSCAVDTAGDVWCWGTNDHSQLGYPGNTPPYQRAAAKVPLGGRIALGVSAGREHTCALVAPGGAATKNDVLCWGANAAGQLGNGGTADEHQPVVVNPGIPGQFVSIGVGWIASCGIVRDGPIPVTTSWGGQLVCWGGGSFAAILGRNGHGPVSTMPGPIASSDEFLQVVVGATHVCAARLDNVILCWGSNGLGQLGRGPAGGFADSAEPRPIAGR